jgi:hypothetical protein
MINTELFSIISWLWFFEVSIPRNFLRSLHIISIVVRIV